MSNEYTPQTGAVRVAYGWTGHDSYIESNRQAKEAEFDRWLEAHDREVAEKAWEAGRKAAFSDEFGDLGQYTPNPYKEKP